MDTRSSSKDSAQAEPIGIETRQQKAELEAALFGTPSEAVRIAHYEVIGTLGSGGMGVVYVVYDHKLDRRVALKLLRYRDAGEVARTRMLREAQAMARLQHPNVVTVHEVGTHQGQIFIAMEFVSGSHLRAWLAAHKPSWRETVAAFIQAGEGLAAAHDAGITHRDFKPDNVLVGDDGRVRVADFGLAHGLHDKHDTPELRSSSDSAISLDTPLTETGALVGTPAYMAPEQHTGLRITAQTDQFSFCVSLWEALYGKRPFVADTLPALVEAVLGERITEPTDHGEVPQWLRAVLLRGLALDPLRRWPSMRPLLDALARDPERLRRRRVRIGLLATLTLTIMATLGMRASTERRHNARQRYWNATTETLLEIERERGLRQANDDARRAKNASRMSGYLRFRPKRGFVEHEDPTLAAALLHEVVGEERTRETWISAANELLGQPLSYAVLDGHRSKILALAFAPDARTLYSAASNGIVRRWSLAQATGATIIEQRGEVVSLAVNARTGELASGAKDGTVMLWSPDEPDHPRLFVTHGDEITVVRFDPGGRYLATASKDHMAMVAELGSDTRRSFEGHTGPIYALDFDASGERLLTASADHSARLWSVADGTELARLDGHTDALFHARFVGETRAVTGSDDGTVRVWALDEPAHELRRITSASGRPITTLDVVGSTLASATSDRLLQITQLDQPEDPGMQIEAPAEVWSMRLLPDAKSFVFGSFNANAQRWVVGGSGPIQRFMGHDEAITRVTLDDAGRWLATGSYDGEIRIWDLDRPPLSTPLSGHRGQISALSLAGDHGQLLTASHDGTVRVWAREDGRELQRFTTGNDAIYTLALHPDHTRFAVGTQAGLVVLGSVGKTELRTLTGHQDQVWDVAFNAAGTHLASASIDGTTRIWTLDEDAEDADVLVLREPEGYPTRVAFHAPHGRIATAASSGAVHLWNRDSGALEATLSGHHAMIWTLARSPDGRTLATASDDGTARLWPDDDPTHALVLRDHEQVVWSIVFDSLGQRVLTASADATAKMWTLQGKLLRTFSGHSQGVWAANILHDGRVVTASEDNTIRVWPVRDGDAAINLFAHANAVILLETDTERVYSGSADHNLKIWRLDQLESEVEILGDRLEAATIWCLDAERRVRELGENPARAREAQAACEATRAQPRADGQRTLSAR